MSHQSRACCLVVSQEDIKKYQEALACVWPRFLWSSVHGDYAGEDDTQVRAMHKAHSAPKRVDIQESVGI